MSALFKILTLLCIINFVCDCYGQSPGTRTRGKMKDSDTVKSDQNTEDSLNQIDYGPIIEKIKEELNSMSKRLKEFENGQKGLKEYEQVFDLTNKAVNDLKAKIDKISTSSITKLREDIDKLQQVFEIATANYDKSFKEMKNRFDGIEKEMKTYDKHLQKVYDSTIGSVFDRLFKQILDYLADFGEVCVNIGGVIIDKIESIDWKSYYDTITDPKQQQLFKEWILGVIDYVKFWWISGIQPAIITQATQLYIAIQTGTKDTIIFVHNHILYLELSTQAQPYLDMANVPQDFTQYFIDGFLVLFVLSSLFTLSFICSCLCDCCCPIKSAKDQEMIKPINRQTTKSGKKKKVKGRK